MKYFTEDIILKFQRGGSNKKKKDNKPSGNSQQTTTPTSEYTTVYGGVPSWYKPPVVDNTSTIGMAQQQIQRQIEIANIRRNQPLNPPKPKYQPPQAEFRQGRSESEQKQHEADLRRAKLQNSYNEQYNQLYGLGRPNTEYNQQLVENLPYYQQVLKNYFDRSIGEIVGGELQAGTDIMMAPFKEAKNQWDQANAAGLDGRYFDAMGHALLGSASVATSPLVAPVFMGPGRVAPATSTAPRTAPVVRTTAPRTGYAYDFRFQDPIVPEYSVVPARQAIVRTTEGQYAAIDMGEPRMQMTKIRGQWPIVVERTPRTATPGTPYARNTGKPAGKPIVNETPTPTTNGTVPAPTGGNVVTRNGNYRPIYTEHQTVTPGEVNIGEINESNWQPEFANGRYFNENGTAISQEINYSPTYTEVGFNTPLSAGTRYFRRNNWAQRVLSGGKEYSPISAVRTNTGFGRFNTTVGQYQNFGLYRNLWYNHPWFMGTTHGILLGLPLYGRLSGNGVFPTVEKAAEKVGEEGDRTLRGNTAVNKDKADKAQAERQAAEAAEKAKNDSLENVRYNEELRAITDSTKKATQNALDQLGQ